MLDSPDGLLFVPYKRNIPKMIPSEFVLLVLSLTRNTKRETSFTRGKLLITVEWSVSLELNTENAFPKSHVNI